MKRILRSLFAAALLHAPASALAQTAPQHPSVHEIQALTATLGETMQAYIAARTAFLAALAREQALTVELAKAKDELAAKAKAEPKPEAKPAP